MAADGLYAMEGPGVNQALANSLGTRRGARVASLRCPILRSGRNHRSSFEYVPATARAPANDGPEKPPILEAQKRINPGGCRGAKPPDEGP